ncbi:ATP-binding cassette domain-containing protein [Tenacibaculum sp. SZ-18]|uniref:ATP-binding cassette domain-containing protein n=1 Tax=Tenacibaculum sp. SZ-18 TaxID=754423 RepID=UPI001E352A6F
MVGLSGSGKSTLFKILLKHYDTYEGSVLLGNQNLHNISASAWRSISGAVLQDGVIFDGTIAKNITLGSSVSDKEKLRHVSEITNCFDFISKFPLGFNTIIGGRIGLQLSAGEMQRILIARALYKDPDFFFR